MGKKGAKRERRLSSSSDDIDAGVADAAARGAGARRRKPTAAAAAAAAAAAEAEAEAAAAEAEAAGTTARSHGRKSNNWSEKEIGSLLRAVRTVGLPSSKTSLDWNVVRMRMKSSRGVAAIAQKFGDLSRATVDGDPTEPLAAYREEARRIVFKDGEAAGAVTIALAPLSAGTTTAASPSSASSRMASYGAFAINAEPLAGGLMPAAAAAAAAAPPPATTDLDAAIALEISGDGYDSPDDVEAVDDATPAFFPPSAAGRKAPSAGMPFSLAGAGAVCSAVRTGTGPAGYSFQGDPDARGQPPRVRAATLAERRVKAAGGAGGGKHATTGDDLGAAVDKIGRTWHETQKEKADTARMYMMESYEREERREERRRDELRADREREREREEREREREERREDRRRDEAAQRNLMYMQMFTVAVGGFRDAAAQWGGGSSSAAGSSGKRAVPAEEVGRAVRPRTDDTTTTD